MAHPGGSSWLQQKKQNSALWGGEGEVGVSESGGAPSPMAVGLGCFKFRNISGTCSLQDALEEDLPM